MTTPAWRQALPTPPAGCQLRGAWLTSFEPPDAALLVEHLLPSLLGVSGELTTETGVKVIAPHPPTTVVSKMTSKNEGNGDDEEEEGWGDDWD